MKRIKMSAVINRVRYDTEKATLIADDVYWDGHNFEHGGRNQWLYRTKRGNYFTVNGTFWQGESNDLAPVSVEEAQELWQSSLSEHYVSFEEAFPGVKVEEA